MDTTFDYVIVFNIFTTMPKYYVKVYEVLFIHYYNYMTIRNNTLLSEMQMKPSTLVIEERQ